MSSVLIKYFFREWDACKTNKTSELLLFFFFFFFLEESDFSSLLYLIAVEYYIYERPSDYVDNRLKNMEIFDSTILRFSIFKIGREYILFLVQYVSTIL